MASSKLSRENKDFISDVPIDVANKILELLPIRMAARTSLLSKQWRSNWLSLQCLDFNFNDEFCEEQKFEDGSCNWQECSNIISSILLHHNGPIQDFKLYIPDDLHEEYLNLSQWLCFLSKNGVKKITLYNCGPNLDLSSYVFCCNELVYLELQSLNLNPLPTGFSGFPKLQSLLLSYIYFSKEDDLRNLIAKCPVLTTLKLDHCGRINHIIIEASSLDTLIVYGYMESLTFRNAHNLKSVFLDTVMKTFDGADLLASLSQLQCIQLGGRISSRICKYLVAGKIPRPFPVAFNNLKKLCLLDQRLDDCHVFDYVCGMIGSCSSIKELDITILPSIKKLDITIFNTYLSYIKVVPSKTESNHKIIYNGNKRLDHLIDIKISGITGSIAELKLIKYLLASSTELETLYFTYGKLNTESKLELCKALTGFPRASTKARLICCSFIMPGFFDGI